MRGKAPCELAWPDAPGARRRAWQPQRRAPPRARWRRGRQADTHLDQEFPVDGKLLAALKKKRDEIAREEGKSAALLHFL